MFGNKRILRFIALILLVLWMSLIFGLSSQNAANSASVSSGLSRKIVSMLYPKFEDLSEAEQREILSSLAFPVRKAAHFSLFAVLGVIAFWNVSFFDKLSLKVKSLISIGFSSLYAATDEFHQLFIEGRSGELRDIFIDTAGAIFSISVLLIVRQIALKKKAKKIAEENYDKA